MARAGIRGRRGAERGPRGTHDASPCAERAEGLKCFLGSRVAAHRRLSVPPGSREQSAQNQRRDQPLQPAGPRIQPQDPTTSLWIPTTSRRTPQPGAGPSNQPQDATTSPSTLATSWLLPTGPHLQTPKSLPLPSHSRQPGEEISQTLLWAAVVTSADRLPGLPWGTDVPTAVLHLHVHHPMLPCRYSPVAPVVDDLPE